MSKWRMTAAHFRYLLEDVQDYRCNISGMPLEPSTVWIMPIIPRSKGGKPGPNNVQLLHESVVKLARNYTKEEIIFICKTVMEHNK